MGTKFKKLPDFRVSVRGPDGHYKLRVPAYQTSIPGLAATRPVVPGATAKHVSRVVESGWSITHMPSGHAVTNFRGKNLANADKLAQVIASETGYDFTQDADKIGSRPKGLTDLLTDLADYGPIAWWSDRWIE